MSYSRVYPHANDIDFDPEHWNSVDTWIWEAKTHHGRLYNVKDYGALGDGSTDDTLAIQAAVADMSSDPVDQPGVLFFPAGSYQISGTITLPTQNFGRMCGEGAQSKISQIASTNADMFSVNGSYWHIHDLQIVGTDGAGGSAVVLGSTAYHCWLDTLYIYGAKSCGVKVNNGAASSAKLTNLQINASTLHGIWITGSSSDCEIIGCWVGGSGSDGIRVDVSATQITNCHCWGNTGNGIYVGSNVTQVHIVNCDLETNTARGLRLNSTNSGITVVGGRMWRNTLTGVYGYATTNSSFTGIIVYENGFGTAGSAGMTFDSSFDIAITGCQFYDGQGTKTQTYAVQSLNTADRIMFFGNSMRAAQHKTGSTTLVGSNNLPATLSTANTV